MDCSCISLLVLWYMTSQCSSSLHYVLNMCKYHPYLNVGNKRCLVYHIPVIGGLSWNKFLCSDAHALVSLRTCPAFSCRVVTINLKFLNVRPVMKSIICYILDGLGQVTRNYHQDLRPLLFMY